MRPSPAPAQRARHNPLTLPGRLAKTAGHRLSPRVRPQPCRAKQRQKRQRTERTHQRNRPRLIPVSRVRPASVEKRRRRARHLECLATRRAPPRTRRACQRTKRRRPRNKRMLPSPRKTAILRPRRAMAKGHRDNLPLPVQPRIQRTDLPASRAMPKAAHVVLPAGADSLRRMNWRKARSPSRRRPISPHLMPRRHSRTPR